MIPRGFNPDDRLCARFLVTLFVVGMLTACGGGSESQSGPVTPPPTASTISGVGMLGAISGANVEVIGTSGSLGTGQTNANGHFGPIGYPSTYDGPLKIVVSGSSNSTWTCDFRDGCFVNGTVFAFGESIPFDFTLEAVLPTAASGQTVSVSLLSNMVAARTTVLGGFTAANVIQANADIADMLRLVLGDVFTDLGVTLPDNFSRIELVNLNQLPPRGGNDDPLRTTLSLFNGALMGMSLLNQTTGAFVNGITSSVAARPQLPVAAILPLDPSQESFLIFFVIQILDMLDNADATTNNLNQLLSPRNLDSLFNTSFDAFLALPALQPALPEFFDINIDIDDQALRGPINRTFEIVTTTGAPLNFDEIDVFITQDPSGDWLSGQIVVVSTNGPPNVRLDFDTSIIAALPNGIYQGFAEIFSLTEEYRRHFVLVQINVSLTGTVVDAGTDFSARERATVMLSGFTNRPQDVQSVNWVQTAGPAAIISNGTTLQPSIELPSIASNQTVSFRLDLDFTTGEIQSDTINIQVVAFLNIADVSLPDAVLQQCVDDAATAGGLIEAQELTSLACSNVADTTTLEAFSGLATLELPNNSLDSLQTLINMTSLQFLDISGNPELACLEIDVLAQRLTEGVTLLVSDLCRATIPVDLADWGFDAAIDDARNQMYISIPDRNELAVVSLSEFRVIDRILLPGSPYGIDISIDGTRVFAALFGSNAVASIDIDQRTVSVIPLADATGHARTYDVVEGATDRLFVSASPGSSGFAYIAQVRLDQGNITSRAANGRIIRATPTFARSPDTQFVYASEGFSPNSLYKLSLADPDAGIVLEDAHGSVSGTHNLALNSTGSRISLSSGQILRTGSFIEEGRVSAGVTTASNISDTLFVARPGGGIEFFDFTTLELIDTLSTGCTNQSSTRIVAFDNDRSFLLLQGNVACMYASVSRSVPPDPFAALRFPDLALEECVINAAISTGFAQLDEFIQLDCSITPRSIRSLDTIDRMTNLEILNVSNSGVFDLSPLTTLTPLQSLVIRDAAVTDVTPLFNLGSLNNFDARGNNGISCIDLRQLEFSGVVVQADLCARRLRIELGGIGADMEMDEINDRVFVSIPSLQQVAEVSLATASVVQRHTLPGQPYGIDLASDNVTIYAALNGLGDIAYLNINDGSMQIVDISTELDDDRTWDIAEISPNRIVVSSNPGSSGFAYIVEVRRDQADAAVRVASNRIIRAAPTIAVSPDQLAVYVGEGFSPNSLYKLDATQSSLPIILEDDHGSVGGTSNLALTPDGTRIYLQSGQTLATDTFNQVAQFPSGRSAVSGDGTKLLIHDGEATAAGVYDTALTSKIGRREWGCNILNLKALQEFGADGVIALGDDLVCFSDTVSFP